MAENTWTGASTASAQQFAVEEIATIEYPCVWLSFGTEGVAPTRVSDTNPLPVDDAGGSLTVDASQLDIDNLNKNDDEVLVWANTAKDGTGTDYVPLVDTDGHLQVDVLSGASGGTQYAVDTALGSTPTGTLSVAIRDDALSSLTPVEGDAVGLRVDANGALWVIPSGTVAVSASSLPLPTGASTAANQATANSSLADIETNTDFGAVTGGGVEASALRVTLASDSTGLVSVDDNGGSLTVDGTVTANLSATDNAVLDSIQTAVELIDNAISGTEMQVDVVAPLPAGTNAIGKLAANDGVDIGDVDVASLPSTVHSADYDTGGGTDTTLAFGIAVPASGGAAVVPGDATAGLKVNLGADNDVTLATLPDTGSSDMATINTNTANAATALQIIDDWDETNRAAVNLIASQAGVAGGTGTDAGNVLRVSLATDIALPAGTNAIGKLAANSGVDIGDVDVLTIPNSSNQASATVTGLDTVFDSDGDNTAQQVKASSGRLYGIEVSNPNSADAYLQLFDVANGSITVGTTTPKLSLFVPAGDGTKDGAMDKVFDPPITFGTAINYACTTTATGSGDPTTGLIVNVLYK